MVTKIKCPYCESDDICEIEYGHPGFKKPDKGKISGGCIVSDNFPNWRCLVCGYGWK